MNRRTFGGEVVILILSCCFSLFGLLGVGCMEGNGEQDEGFLLAYRKEGGFAGGLHESLVIYTGGTVTPGASKGERRIRVTSSAASELSELIDKSGFWGWRSNSAGNWADLFEMTITVQAGGRKKEVTFYELPDEDAGFGAKFLKLVSDVEKLARKNSEEQKATSPAVSAPHQYVRGLMLGGKARVRVVVGDLAHSAFLNPAQQREFLKRLSSLKTTEAPLPDNTAVRPPPSCNIDIWADGTDRVSGACDAQIQFYEELRDEAEFYVFADVDGKGRFMLDGTSELLKWAVALVPRENMIQREE